MSNAQTTSCTSECAEPLYCAWTEWSLPRSGVVIAVCTFVFSPPGPGLGLDWFFRAQCAARSGSTACAQCGCQPRSHSNADSEGKTSNLKSSEPKVLPPLWWTGHWAWSFVRDVSMYLKKLMSKSDRTLGFGVWKLSMHPERLHNQRSWNRAIFLQGVSDLVILKRVALVTSPLL